MPDNTGTRYQEVGGLARARRVGIIQSKRDNPGATLVQLSALYGVTAERVRQILVKNRVPTARSQKNQ